MPRHRGVTSANAPKVPLTVGRPWSEGGVKDAALNRVICLNTHLDEAHISLDQSKLVLFRIYNHVQMCRIQN